MHIEEIMFFRNLLNNNKTSLPLKGGNQVEESMTVI